LPVPEEAFLLLEFLDLVIVGALRNQLVDVLEAPIGRDVEAAILLSDSSSARAGRAG
jgi:hypothetical protein